MICPHCNKTISQADVLQSISDSEREAVGRDRARRSARVAHLLPDPESPSSVLLVVSPATLARGEDCW